MKELDSLHIPDDRRYSDDHEWAIKTGNVIRVGISDYAQDQLGDIVFVELPSVGDTFAVNESFGVIEAVKTVADMLMPVGGEIVAVNTDLESSPETVNGNPYETGWMIDVRPDDSGDMERLMDAGAYLDFLKGGH